MIFYLFKTILNNSLLTFHRFSLPFRIRLIENIHASLPKSLSQADELPLGLLHASHVDTFLFGKNIFLLVLNLIINHRFLKGMLLFYWKLIRNFHKALYFLLGFIFYLNLRASCFMNFLIIMMVQLAKYFITFYLFFLIALVLVLMNIFWILLVRTINQNFIFFLILVNVYLIY